MTKEQLPAIFTLTEKADKAKTREEAQEVLQLLAAMENVAAQWLNDTEQIDR